MFVRTQQGPVKAVHVCGRKFIYTKAYIICEQVWLRFCNEPHLYFRPFIAAEGTSEAQLRVALKHTAGILIDSGYFWDDFTAFFHIHHVAYMQVQSFDNICIVQRGTFHNGAGQLHGVQIGNRSHCTGTSYLIGDFVQPCQCTFCLKFVCDGPSGGLRCESQILLLF